MPPYKGPRRTKHQCNLTTAFLISSVTIVFVVLTMLTLRQHRRIHNVIVENSVAPKLTNEEVVDPVIQSRRVGAAVSKMGEQSVPSVSPPPHPLPSPPPLSDMCHTDEHNEYQGSLVTWGTNNMQETAAGCCESCAQAAGCNVWVWCGNASGCGYGDSPQKQHECWLKNNTMEYIMSNYKKGNPGIQWTSGALYSAAQYKEWEEEHKQKIAAEKARLEALRNNAELPLVFFDISLNGVPQGRIEMVLFVKESPRAAGNFRVICSGELGKAENGAMKSFKGSTFYRIIDRFIDQTGAVQVDSIFGGSFHDDPGGLKLIHDRKGLLSMANGGPNTNGGHFSILQGPAPHLNGNYVVFGEVVSGFEIAARINKLSYGQKNNELLGSRAAEITDCGQLRRGTYVDTPEFEAVIRAEKERITARRDMDIKDMMRVSALAKDTELPMVFFDIAIKGVYVGRIEMVLFARESPLAAENFRALCTGEAGVAPQYHEGAGQAYHFKGSYFYRIIHNFIDQTGVTTDSTFNGLFNDDAGGLQLKHDRLGLLSMANIGPNTNGAHFSIIIAPAHHLDGKYTIFGEIVDGHHIARWINDLAKEEPTHEHSNSQDAQIIDSGEVRRGTYIDSAAYRAIISAEKTRVAKTWLAPGTVART